MSGIGEVLVRLDRRFSNQRPEFIHETMDPFGLGAAVPREMERIADDDAGTAVPTRQAKDGALVAARLRALDGEQRLRDPEGVGDRDADPARAHIEAEQRMRWAPASL